MILFSFMIILLAAYKGAKAILLIVVLSEISLNTIITGRFHMHTSIFLLFMFYIMIGLLYRLCSYFGSRILLTVALFLPLKRNKYNKVCFALIFYGDTGDEFDIFDSYDFYRNNYLKKDRELFRDRHW